MRLLVNNQEVPLQRLVPPPVDAFRTVCQLLGVPFREETAVEVFAAFPPLLGRRIILWLCEAPAENAALLERLKQEIKLLERLLWISGADITVCSGELGDCCRTLWDLGLLFYPGSLLPGRIDPVLVISWCKYFVRSRRLWASVASSWHAAGLPPVRRVTSLGLPRQLRSWVARQLSKVPAPAVMVALPMVTGYAESLMDRLGPVVCQGVLSYLGKPLLGATVPDILRTPAAQSPPVQAVPAQATPIQAPAIVNEPPPVAASAARGGEERAVALPLRGAVEETVEEAGDEADDTRERLAWQFLSAKGLAPSKELVAEYMAYLERMGRRAKPP